LFFIGKAASIGLNSDEYWLIRYLFWKNGSRNL